MEGKACGISGLDLTIFCSYWPGCCQQWHSVGSGNGVRLMHLSQLGFASVLSDLGLPQNALILALVGFNLGVEVGQLAIVSVFYR